MGAHQRRLETVDEIRSLLLAMAYFMDIAGIPEYHLPDDAADLDMAILKAGKSHLEEIFDGEFQLALDHYRRTKEEVWESIFNFEETTRPEYQELRRLLRDLAVVMSVSRRPPLFNIRFTNKVLNSKLRGHHEKEASSNRDGNQQGHQ